VSNSHGIFLPGLSFKFILIIKDIQLNDCKIESFVPVFKLILFESGIELNFTGYVNLFMHLILINLIIIHIFTIQLLQKGMFLYQKQEISFPLVRIRKTNKPQMNADLTWKMLFPQE